jgi:hypothetical protein
MASKKSKRTKKAPKKRAAPKKPATRAPAPRRASANDEDLAIALEELEEAHAELARIASGENTAKRELESKVSAAVSTEERLRREMEEIRVDLRTALADLEIERAATARERERVLQLQRDLAEARESERLASHASDRAREQTEALKAELEKLRAPAKAENN